MNTFPSEIEKDFLTFLYDYHFLSFKDAQYLFKSKLYYKKQILDLINDDYIKKHKSGSYILSNAGKRYLKSLGYDFSTKMAYSNEYIQRQKIISFIAAFYYFSDNIKFIPSFLHKDKDIFTIKSRRYIGLIKINNKEYNIIGRLGMYHITIDVTNSNVKIGDEVILDVSPLYVDSNIRREYR